MKLRLAPLLELAMREARGDSLLGYCCLDSPELVGAAELRPFMERPGIEPATKSAVTCAYANGVDGINAP